MAKLINCPVCGRNGVASSAPTCPGCGAELKGKICPQCGSDYLVTKDALSWGLHTFSGYATRCGLCNTMVVNNLVQKRGF